MKKGGLPLSIGVGVASVFAIGIVIMARKYHASMSHDLLTGFILITNMISIAISLFAFSRYTVLKERIIEFIAFAFFTSGFVRILGVIVSDSGIFSVERQSFYFQVASWQGGDFLFALLLAVGMLLVWIFPQPRSTLLDVLSSVVIAMVIMVVIEITSHGNYLSSQILSVNFRPNTSAVSALLLLSFIGVARNHLKYPTLFNYAISITLFLLVLSEFVGSFSSSVTDTATAASAGLSVLAYVFGATGSLVDVGQIFNEYVRNSDNLQIANRELQKYQLYFEKVPDPVRILDENGSTLYVNPAFERDFGYSNSEIKGESIYGLYDPDEKEKVEEYTRLVEQGKGSEYELTVLTKGGQRIEVLLNSSWIIVDGKSVGRITIFRDITRRKQLERRNQILSAAVETSDEAIALTDNEGKITFLNPAAEKLFGYSVDEMRGKSIWETASPSYGYVNAKDIYAKTLGEGNWKGEVLNRRKDGTEYYASLSTSSIKDSDGKVIAIAAVCEDITEKKWDERRKEAAYKVAQIVIKNDRISGLSDSVVDLLSSVLAVPFVVLYLYDEKDKTLGAVAQHNSTGVNITIPSIQRLSEADSSVILLKGDGEGGTDASRAARFRKMVFSPSISETEFAGEPTFDKMSGVVSIPLLSSGELVGVLQYVSVAPPSIMKYEAELANTAASELAVGIQRSRLREKILEQAKELEDSNEQLRISKLWLEEANAQLVQANRQLEDASRLKSQFLANMSHELRTPLNSIIGFTSLVLTDEAQPPTAEQKEGLDIVLRNAKNLLALINDILDLSKIEAGRMTISPEEFNIEAIVKDALTTVEPLIGDKPIKLTYKIESAIPPFYSDSARIKQIVLNLLSNAVKFTDKGHVKVIARVIENNLAALAVEDTGIGISREHLDVVFEEFRQVDGSNTRRHSGTGLGLAISRRLARMLGGDLTVKSELGKGSTFTLIVPLIYRPSESTAAKQDTVTLKQESEFSNVSSTVRRVSTDRTPLVICVDDDKDVLLLLKNHLVSEGFEFYGVNDSRNAIEAIRQYKPILVTLDILMPNKDGWQILQELKSDPELKDIPVVIHTIVDNKALAMSLGAESYLIKPVEAERIVSVIRNFTGTNGGEILVVDDNDDFTNFLQNLLEKSNFTIYTARNGVEAMKFLNQTIPSLVFLDLLMPEMDGFEVVEKMSGDERLKNVPVVVLTAKEVTDEDRAALNSKIKNIVRKEGLNREIILREVNKFIQRRK